MISAACHIHSDWSYDGKWTLPALAAAFGRRGYRVVMMTEHDRGFTEARRQEHRAACAAASSAAVLVLPGIEYSDRANDVHILTWGPVPFLGEGVPTTELLQAVKSAGGVAVLAHPSRRQAWKLFDPAWTDGLLGVEIWNRKTDGWAPSRTAPALLADGGLLPFVGLDFHSARQFFPLTLRIGVCGASTEDTVLAAMASRRVMPLALGMDASTFLKPGVKSRLTHALESVRRTVAQKLR